MLGQNCHRQLGETHTGARSHTLASQGVSRVFVSWKRFSWAEASAFARSL